LLIRTRTKCLEDRKSFRSFLVRTCFGTSYKVDFESSDGMTIQGQRKLFKCPQSDFESDVASHKDATRGKSMFLKSLGNCC
jgi:hypothetical protein